LHRDLGERTAAWHDYLRAARRQPLNPTTPGLLVQALRLAFSSRRGVADGALPDRTSVEAAWRLFHAGAYAEAAAAAEAQLIAAPGSGELHFLLAQSLHNGALDLPRALAAYDAALAAGYDPFWVLAGRARLHRDLGEGTAAWHDYLRAARRQPLNPATPGLLVQALRLAVSPRWRVADGALPDRTPVEAAWRLFHAGAYAEAAAAAEVQLLTAPGSGELHFLLAQSLHNGALNLPRALMAYDAALAAGHDPFAVWAGRARLHRELCHRRAALADSAAALARRPFGSGSGDLVRQSARLLLRPLLVAVGLRSGRTRPKAR
jgi:tetratricopeptide (TPR) repeat protein